MNYEGLITTLRCLFLLVLHESISSSSLHMICHVLCVILGVPLNHTALGCQAVQLSDVWNSSQFMQSRLLFHMLMMFFPAGITSPPMKMTTCCVSLTSTMMTTQRADQWRVIVTRRPWSLQRMCWYMTPYWHKRTFG